MKHSQPSYSIILASGNGTRYGGRKQFSMLHGKELYRNVLEVAMKTTDLVILVVNDDAVADIHNDINRYYNLSESDVKVYVTSGGSERSESVANGLKVLSKLVDSSVKSTTVVFESARPKVTEFQVNQLIESIESGSASSTFYLPVNDAMYSTDDGSRYLTRDQLYSIQTPQAFNTPYLILAHQKSEGDDTYFYEDCHLVLKHLGIQPFLILGSQNLLKITRINDLTSMVNMDRSKTVLITGSTGSLGSALVDHFNKLNYTVLAPTRQELDLSTGSESVKKYVASLDKVPDILINNAGIMKISKFDSDKFEDEYEQMMQVNLTSHLILTRELILKNPSLTTINISSTSGESGRAGFMGYGISKSGMIIMTEALVEEGYSAYCINPGRLKSKLRSEIFGNESDSTLLQPKHVVCVVDNIINGLHKNGSILTVRVDNSIFKVKEFTR